MAKAKLERNIKEFINIMSNIVSSAFAIGCAIHCYNPEASLLIPITAGIISGSAIKVAAIITNSFIDEAAVDTTKESRKKNINRINTITVTPDTPEQTTVIKDAKGFSLTNSRSRIRQ